MRDTLLAYQPMHQLAYGREQVDLLVILLAHTCPWLTQGHGLTPGFSFWSKTGAVSWEVQISFLVLLLAHDFYWITSRGGMANFPLSANMVAASSGGHELAS